MREPIPTVAIVDYGMGNLFSVKQACESVGLRAVVSSEKRVVLSADAVILPGVGAFGDAMSILRRLDLVGVLLDVVAAGNPLVGICLGMQLLMTESEEFGQHRGLNLIEGDVVRLPVSHMGARRLKVPHVGWNTIEAVMAERATAWEHSLLNGLSHGVAMYFVHSYYVRPMDQNQMLSTTTHGPTRFCSALRQGNVFACQFHPERSGPQGLRIYRNLAIVLQRLQLEMRHA